MSGSKRITVGGLSALALAAGVGCHLIESSPLLTKNQMPPPPPITYSRFHQPGWDWAAVGRVVVLSPRNESVYTRAGKEFHGELAAALQRLGRFEVVTAPFDDHARLSSVTHQSGRFDETVLLALATETRADVILLPTVSQYSPYPRPKLGVVVQAVAPAAGKVVASVDGVWDASDGGIAEQVRTYYRQRPTPLPAYVRNHTIVADDNFAADLALESPALFQKFVANKVAAILIGEDSAAAGGNAGGTKGCTPAAVSGTSTAANGCPSPKSPSR